MTNEIQTLQRLGPPNKYDRGFRKSKINSIVCTLRQRLKIRWLLQAVQEVQG